MSLVLTFPGRRLVLAMGDRHGAYQNERSSFVFSVTANNFGHRCSCSSNHSTFRATTSSVNTLNPVNLAWAKRRGYRNVSRVPPSRDQAPITPRPIALTPARQMERSVRIRRFSRVGRFTQRGERCWMSNEEEIVPPNSLADAERGERIRQRAYQLWEEDGSPEGRADVYWHRARELLDQEAQGGGTTS
jgi:Protein of unknown function (DUF2934)